MQEMIGGNVLAYERTNRPPRYPQASTRTHDTTSTVLSSQGGVAVYVEAQHDLPRRPSPTDAAR
ncbi:hypothetical protein Tdes44962_MAKER08451 [Teratosphaeria destructans]|uniref:Uncharacterized protein n=1 Tax=Teratosphaeria destructans TaxID=418781 RepID=A0A9W7W4H5_9PEZI|nr:hypothetical protein Tdes44962_MAKER08451 [Teratosphaeria destructans]